MGHRRAGDCQNVNGKFLGEQGMMVQPKTPTLWSQEREGSEFEARMGYIIRCYLIKKKEEEKNKVSGPRSLSW